MAAMTSRIRASALIAARRFDLYDEPMATLAAVENYATGTASNLIALAAQILNGGRDAVIGLTNHTIQIYLTDITAANIAVGMGKSTIIGQLGSARSPMVPDVPAMSEEGLTPLEVFPWLGLVAPLGVSPAIVEKINRDVTRVLDDPEGKSRAEKLGCDVVTGPPATFAKVLQEQVKLWSPIAREVSKTLEAK